MLETRSEADSDGNAMNRRWNIRRFQNVGSQTPPAPRRLQVRRLALGAVSMRLGWAEGRFLLFSLIPRAPYHLANSGPQNPESPVQHSGSFVFKITNARNR